MGKNDRTKPGKLVVYDDISLICRDAKHVETFASLYHDKYGDVFPPPASTGTSEQDWPVDLAAFIQKHYMSGEAETSILEMVASTFGEASAASAVKILETFTSVKAELQ